MKSQRIDDTSSTPEKSAAEAPSTSPHLSAPSETPLNSDDQGGSIREVEQSSFVSVLKPLVSKTPEELAKEKQLREQQRQEFQPEQEKQQAESDQRHKEWLEQEKSTNNRGSYKPRTKPNKTRSDKGNTRGSYSKRKNKTALRGDSVHYKVLVKEDDGKVTILIDDMNEYDECRPLPVPSGNDRKYPQDIDSIQDNSSVYCVLPLLDDIEGLELDDDKTSDYGYCRLRLKKKHGDFTIGCLYWGLSGTYNDVDYADAQISLVFLYGDDAEETFGRAEYVPNDLSKLTSQPSEVRSRLLLPKSEFLFTPSSTETPEKSEHLDAILSLDFEYPEGHVTRWGAMAKYMGHFNPAGTWLIPLTQYNIKQFRTLSHDMFSGTFSYLQAAIERNEIPENGYSLLLGNNGHSAIILNTHKPDVTKYDKDILGPWKGRAIYGSDFANQFIFCNDLSKKISGKTVVLVEGQNDALTACARLQEHLPDIVVVALAGKTIAMNAVNELSKYIDWESNSYIVYMDNLDYSQKCSNVIMSQLNIAEDSICNAQEFLVIKDEVDPDDYFSTVAEPTLPVIKQKLHCSLQLREDTNLDIFKLFSEYEALTNAFLRIQPKALEAIGIPVDPKELDDDGDLPAVTDINGFNVASPQRKALIRQFHEASSKSVSTLRLSTKHKESNLEPVGYFKGKQWDGLLLTLTDWRQCATMVNANQPLRE